MGQELDADTRAEAVVDALGLLYHDDLDPDDFMLFPDDDGATIEAETTADTPFWNQNQGTRDGFECLVRTILSQNTSDSASQPAHEALLARYDDGDDLAAALADADHATLAETIQSAGLYNQKAEKILGAAEWVREEYGSAAAFDDFVTEGDPGKVRETLLRAAATASSPSTPTSTASPGGWGSRQRPPTTRRSVNTWSGTFPGRNVALATRR
jgi:endonuclease-3